MGQETLATPADPGPGPGSSAAAATPGAAAEGRDVEAPALFPPPASWYVIGNQDSSSRLRVGGLLQFDGRSYLDDPTGALTDTFLIRRARLILAGTLSNLVEFYLLPDFAGGTLNLFDAYLDLRLWSWLALRGGKFKTPFGLERLQEDRDLVFLERGLTADLDPDRDIGISLHGNLGTVRRRADSEHPRLGDEVVLHYDFAALNGAPDGASDNADANIAKDLVARVFAQPFLLAGIEPLAGLGFGGAVTYGRQQGTATASYLPTFVSPGQNTIFTYLPNAVALGYRTRVTPQVFYALGPFGLLGEYVLSRTAVTNGNHSRALNDQAWQVRASILLTGEDSRSQGVVPNQPFDLRMHRYGAVQLAVRYSGLLVDSATFPLFADPTKSINRATNFGGQANWYFTYNFKLGVEFDRTDFNGGAATGDRPAENALLARMQAAF